MKRIALITGITALLFTMGIAQLTAQERGVKISPEQKEKIESMQIAFITQKIELTPQQAEKFWPIYNEYQKEQKALKTEFEWPETDPMQMDQKEAEKVLNTILTQKEKNLDLEKSFYDNVKKVLNSNQILALSQAERQFKRHMLREVRSKMRGDQEQIEMRQERMHRFKKEAPKNRQGGSER
nr:hypothetical protein [Saprospiraceae bacterium]